MIEWLLYFQFINDNIDTINVLLGIAILAFPIFTEIKHPKRQHPLPPKHEILRINSCQTPHPSPLPQGEGTFLDDF